MIEYYTSGVEAAVRSEQFADDWNVVPFVEIITTDALNCPSGYEPVFERVWGGTAEGCVVGYWDEFAPDGWTELVIDKSRFEDSIYKDGMADKVRPLTPWEDGSYCKLMPAIEPVSQINFDGKAICGKRGGKSFLEVTRPDPETYECPSGTQACNDRTGPDVTVCYPPSELAASCPITEIRLLTTAEVTSSSAMFEYTILNYSSELSLGYSKSTNNLPITSTRVEKRPCNDPDQSSDHVYCYLGQE